MADGKEIAHSAEKSKRLQTAFPLLSEEEQLFVLGQAERVKAAQDIREKLPVGQNYTTVGRGR
jgi:hypothetical protein